MTPFFMGLNFFLQEFTSLAFINTGKENFFIALTMDLCSSTNKVLGTSIFTEFTRLS